MNTLQNIAISASAGSGKTYTLTNRFIYLLHAFEQPERIIALTFTRTAADVQNIRLLTNFHFASVRTNAFLRGDCPSISLIPHPNV